MPVRVFVVDRHPVVRHGIRHIAATASDIEVVGEATFGRDVVELLRTVACDVLIMDLSLTEVEGLKLLEELKVSEKNLPILVLTTQSEEQFALRVLRLGANAYLHMSCPASEIIDAIRTVAAGGRYLTKQLTERITTDALERRPELPHEGLSRREYQVFQLIASGQSARDAAKALGLRAKTVSTYRSRVYTKLNLRSPAALAAYAVRHQLID